jgi:DNA replicative helicase MCM subunit Mcm2 (Cdc46/Mcm family)
MQEEKAFESTYDYTEASSVNPNEVMIRFQCLNCSAKYEVLYDLNSGHGEPEGCPFCLKRSAKRLDTDEEAGEENN